MPDTKFNMDMAMVNARLAEHDRRLDVFASQYSQLSVEIGIMKASVGEIKVLVFEIEKKAEAHAEAIAKSLEKIMYALGIDDGQPGTAEAVRLTIKGNVKGRAEKQGRIKNIIDDTVKWGIRGILLFILGCVLLFAQQYIKQVAATPIKIEGR